MHNVCQHFELVSYLSRTLWLNVAPWFIITSIDDITVSMISGPCFFSLLLHVASGRKNSPLMLQCRDKWKNVSFRLIMQATKCDELYGDMRQCSHEKPALKLTSTHLPYSNSILLIVIDVSRPVSCTCTRCLVARCLQFGVVNVRYATSSCLGFALVWCVACDAMRWWCDDVMWCERAICGLEDFLFIPPKFKLIWVYWGVANIFKISIFQEALE